MSKSKTPDIRVKPLNNRLVVRVAEAEKMTPGGLYLPDQSREQNKPQRGEVLAVGPGKLNEDGSRYKMSVKIGDVILFQRWSGSDIKDMGNNLIILLEDDVLGVIE